jgi:hypothetical protein
MKTPPVLPRDCELGDPAPQYEQVPHAVLLRAGRRIVIDAPVPARS